MTITARYSGRCATCGGPITPGQQIEWIKGGASRHTDCQPTSQRASTPRRTSTGRTYSRRRAGLAYSSAPAVSRRLRDPREGEQIIHRNSRDYTAGETIHATRVPGGGGPDGHYWTVVAAGSHRISEWEDDTREGDTLYDAIVRPATDDEATACAARIAQAQAAATARTEALRALQTGEGQGRGWRTPAGSRIIAREPQGGSLASKDYVVAAPDGTVYTVDPVYDDDPIVRRLDLTVEQAIEAARLAGWSIEQ